MADIRLKDWFRPIGQTIRQMRHWVIGAILLGATAVDCVFCPPCLLADINSIPYSSGKFNNTVHSISTHLSNAAIIRTPLFSIVDGCNTIVDGPA